MPSLLINDTFTCNSCGEIFPYTIDYNDCHDFLPRPLNFDNNTFKHLRFKRCFGIELEINDKHLEYKDIENNTCFGSKEDGSLDCGSEFYSPILQGDKGYLAIKKFCDTIRKPNIGVCTGYHLHLDARNLYLKDIQKIWLLYRIFEGVLYHMLPNSRTNNRYCRPSNININNIYICHYTNLENFWYSQDDEDEDRTGHYNPTRYFGFNLHSYFYQSTIEIRYHSGTADFNKIINWIKINQSLVKFALNHSLKEIYQLHNLNKYKTNYSKIRYLFKTVISSDFLWTYYKQRFAKFSENNYEYGQYKHKG